MLQYDISVQSKQEINWDQLENFLRQQFTHLAHEPMNVKQFSAGYSNLTYALQIGTWEAVLRRPPFGPTPPKAHNMEREYQLLMNLHPTFPLAPKPYLFSDNQSIMDKHFYIMERKQGLVLDETIPQDYQHLPNIESLISETVVDTLVKLHDLDYKKTDLASLGHPKGYVTRQVNSWMKRYHHSKTADITGVKEIEKWLLNHIPASPEPTIVHNDFKLNNMLFSATDPGKAVAVFDWEMCTIGDPLTDLGSALAYWTEAGEPENGLTSVTNQPGFMTRRAFMERYAKKSGRDVSAIDFYLTFAFFKLAVILQQIYNRWKQGQIADDRFRHLHVGIENLMIQAHRAKEKRLL